MIQSADWPLLIEDFFETALFDLLASNSITHHLSTTLSLMAALLIFLCTCFLAPSTSQDAFGTMSTTPIASEDIIDWNEPWRYKYLNSSKLTADWRVSCTGYRPVCRGQDLMDGEDIAEKNANTAKPTVITAENNGTTPTLGDINYFCSENRLEKPTIYLTAGNNWESTYLVWIAQILIQELLQIPVVIRENIGASHSFYLNRVPKSEKVMARDPDALNLIDESR